MLNDISFMLLSNPDWEYGGVVPEYSWCRMVCSDGGKEDGEQCTHGWAGREQEQNPVARASDS